MCGALCPQANANGVTSGLTLGPGLLRSPPSACCGPPRACLTRPGRTQTVPSTTSSVCAPYGDNSQPSAAQLSTTVIQ